MLTSRPSRPGFTLVELIVGMVVAAVVGMAATTIAVRHEHLAFALEQIMESRRALREGADMLRYDLRATAPQYDAIYSMGGTYVEFRLATGFSVVCGLDSTRTRLVLPARAGSTSNITSWIVAPEPGDTLMIFAAHASADSARWYTRAVASAPTAGGTCSPDFIGDGVGESKLVLRLATPVSADVSVGAVLRFVRRTRYELYKASDGAWYLGFRDCLPTRATPCATIQPVSGAYAASGLQFRFLDSADLPTADPSRVARIDVMLRAETASRLHVPGMATGKFADSVLFTIRPRR
jgi:prepilin-type N-terminal cleavage/methylation domain-containing protein